MMSVSRAGLFLYCGKEFLAGAWSSYDMAALKNLEGTTEPHDPELALDSRLK